MRARRRSLDLGQVILVAAGAGGRCPDEVLAGADLTLLALIGARTRAATSRSRAAAELLVGVAAGRPFDRGNSAAAWALAVHVLGRGRRREVHIDPADAVELVRAAATGRVTEPEVASRLQAAVGSRGYDPTTAGLFRFPTPPAPADWICPACGRSVRVPPWRSSIFLLEPLAADVVRDCAKQHRGHATTDSPWRFRLRRAVGSGAPPSVSTPAPAFART